MELYKKKGFNFTKNLIILNKNKTKYLLGFQISIGINADNPQSFTTANWFFIGGGFNLKEGERIPGLYFKWNVNKLPPNKGRKAT